MAQLCIVLKKIKYVNLPCLFSVVLCGLGEVPIPSVSWAWGACGISYTLLLIWKRTIITLLHWGSKKDSRISIPKLDHEMFVTILAGILWRSDFFSDPVRVLSIGLNPIQVLLIRSDPVRVLSIRSDPIRSWFCKRPTRSNNQSQHYLLRDGVRLSIG